MSGRTFYGNFTADNFNHSLYQRKAKAVSLGSVGSITLIKLFKNPCLYISPRYLANIENRGQQPSLQVFYDLVTRYHISVDQFFFPNSNAEKSTQRLQLDKMLDDMSDNGLRIVTATAKEITEVEKTED